MCNVHDVWWVYNQKNIKKNMMLVCLQMIGYAPEKLHCWRTQCFFFARASQRICPTLALVSRKAAVSRCLTNQLFRGALILDKPSHEKSSSPFSWCFRVSLKIGHPRFTNTSTTRGCQGSPTAASPWTTSRSCKVTGHWGLTFLEQILYDSLRYVCPL